LKQLVSCYSKKNQAFFPLEQVPTVQGLKLRNLPRGTLKLGHLKPVNLRMLHGVDIPMADYYIGTAMSNCGFVY
jgi:hypothetical protein